MLVSYKQIFHNSRSFMKYNFHQSLPGRTIVCRPSREPSIHKWQDPLLMHLTHVDASLVYATKDMFMRNLWCRLYICYAFYIEIKHSCHVCERDLARRSMLTHQYIIFVFFSIYRSFIWRVWWLLGTSWNAINLCPFSIQILKYK